MDLGMICYEPHDRLNRRILKKIRDRGLSFTEFCVNENHDPEVFAINIVLLQEAKHDFGLQIGSIGRWGSDRISTLSTSMSLNRTAS